MLEINEEELLGSIKTMYADSGLTPTMLSSKSGVPVQTLNRYFAGQTKSPSFTYLCQVIVALGGSVDALIGIQNRESASSNVISNDERYVNCLENDLQYERKQKRTWSIAFVSAVAFLVAVLIFDLLNPSIGYIQYAKAAMEFAGSNPTVASGLSVIQEVISSGAI